MHISGKKIINSRYFKAITFSTLAISCLVIGLLVSSGINWTRPLAAQTLTPKPQVAVAPPGARPDSLAALAKKLSPSVVNIKVVKMEKAAFDQPEMEFPDGQFGDLFKKFFKEMPRMPKNYRSQGAGSGVVISKDGYVLTNNHVVAGAKEVTVTLADQKEYKAKVVGCDAKTDLAVLKIKSSQSFPAASLGDSDQLQVGDWVVAIGNPFGLNNTVTCGIVSAKGRVIGAGPYDDFIQTDASINPGNSGGALLNMKGELVGINTAIIAQGQGIGFAIPVNTAKPLVPQLISKGAVTRGYLGVNIQSITPELAKAMNLKDSQGALVADVVAGGPADQAGIKRGDVIIAFNGKAVKDSHHLPPMVAATPVNQQAAVTLLRNGKEQKISLKVGQLPGEKTASAQSVHPASGKWGLQLRDVTPPMAQRLHLQKEQGVVVAGIEPGSRADDAGIQRGDLILEVNRQPVSSVKDVLKNIDRSKDKDHLLLLVQRQDGKFFVPLKQQG
ncbi:MAG: DegQ family serine endoprotease [Syntrophales bacterium]|nr:DegQ family serine endoprotease [Syntrophales bacterium]MDD5640845.1 DegQ family serine endoprotease [Syntrophales bacterium]